MKRFIQRTTALLSMLFVSLAACSGSAIEGDRRQNEVP